MEGDRLGGGGALSVSSLLDRFLRHVNYQLLHLHYTPFSILAVGSFPQTSPAGREENVTEYFQYPRCWIVSSDGRRAVDSVDAADLSVSSLLDRFLRRSNRRDTSGAALALSVSSLLDRFLRREAARRNNEHQASFSILAVGSFPQTAVDGR